MKCLKSKLHFKSNNLSTLYKYKINVENVLKPK